MRSKVIPAKTENARKIRLLSLALIMVGSCGSNVFALDLMGPPNVELDKGMLSGGIEYSFSSIDLNLIEGNAIIYRNGVPLGSGTVESVTIKNLDINTLYAIVGYGIVENYEVFLRMGAAKATFGDSLWDEGEDFDSNIDFAIGAGIKANFYQGFNWKVGGIFQINRTELDGKLDSSSWGITQPNFVEISSTEMQIAMGVTYLWTSRVSVYGGPFVHFISGNFDYTFNRILDANFDTGEFSWEFKEGPTYGGYLGAQIKLGNNSSANLEFQQTSDANIFGANISLRY